MDTVSLRIENYWTKRAHDFNTVRRNELENEISDRWMREFDQYLPQKRELNILDVGTGTGYFAILLSREGHHVTGIDLTEAMLEEAMTTAADYHVKPNFLKMDAQKTDFADCSFDVIVTRNLTWTLPDPCAAYTEWYRLLKKDGLLLNFDANYADNVRNHHQKNSYISPSDVYGHCGVTVDLQNESDDITLSMPCSVHHRPEWDMDIMNRVGFSSCGADKELGHRVLMEHDLSDAPLFVVWAKK